MTDTSYAERKLPPMKLSELIEMGLADIEAVEQMENVAIRMDFWHKYKPQSNREVFADCAVCFAGAVMTQRLGVKVDGSCHDFDPDWGHFGEITPDSFSDPVTACQLNALNELRTGNIGAAIMHMNRRGLPDEIPTDALDCFCRITRYDCSPEKFKADMQGLARALKSAGL